MDVRVEQLRRFLVLAEELHFSRAAARLHLSQQVLSAQTRALEAAVGVRLLTRTTRRVELTPAGRAFVGHAAAAVAEFNAAVVAARSVGRVARVRLACQVDAQWLLADVLQSVDPAFLQVQTVLAVDLASLLENVDVDGVVGWGPIPQQGAEHPVVLAVEEVHAVLRADDPLAAGGAAAVATLAERTLWMWAREQGDPADWDRLVDHVDPSRGSVMVVSTGGAPAQEQMITAVRDKGGYTFAPSRYLAQARPGEVVGLAVDPPLCLAATLSWTGTPSPGLRRLLQAVIPSTDSPTPALDQRHPRKFVEEHG